MLTGAGGDGGNSAWESPRQEGGKRAWRADMEHKYKLHGPCPLQEYIQIFTFMVNGFLTYYISYRVLHRSQHELVRLIYVDQMAKNLLS